MRDAPAGKPDLPGGDAAGWVNEPDHRRTGNRLARPGFADHAQDLAGSDCERDVVDGDECPVPGRKLDPEIRDGEQRPRLPAG
jgi:hypothetical protein